MARIGKYVAESQPRQSYEPGIEQADQSKMHRLAQPKIRQTRKDNVIFLINTVGPSGKYERYKKLQNDIFPHTTPCVAFSRDGCLSIETRSRKCVRTSEETIVAGISPSGSLGTPFPLPRVCRDVRRRGGGGAYADVRTNFSCINRLPDFLTNGASRASFAIWSSAKKKGKRSKSTPVKLCRHFCNYVL